MAVRTAMALEGNTYPYNATLRAISVGRRRAIVGAVLDGGEPLSERALVDRLGADDRARASGDRPPDDVESLRIGLVHDHLPALAAVGLVDWDRDGHTVVPGPHPAVEDSRFRRIVDLDVAGLDAALSGVSHEHRRIPLTVLREVPDPVTTADLARVVRRHEAELPERRPAGVDDLVLTLRHAHLPKLAEADLVEFDAEAGHAAYTGHPAVERVFGIVHGRNERVAERLDAFFDGLHDSYRRASSGAGTSAGWPRFWGDPHRG